MHDLTAISLGLPGTPLHGLDDVEPRARFASPPIRLGRPGRPVPGTGEPAPRRRSRRLSQRRLAAGLRTIQGGCG